jgi:hypothetical protein
MVSTLTADPDLRGVPPEIAAIAAQCLTREPGARPSVQDILSEVRSASPSAPDAPRPERRPPVRTRAITDERPREMAEEPEVASDDTSDSRQPPPTTGQIALAGILIAVFVGGVTWLLIDSVAGAIAAVAVVGPAIAAVRHDALISSGDDFSFFLIGGCALATPVGGLIVSIQQFDLPWWWHIGVAIGFLAGAIVAFFLAFFCSMAVDEDPSTGAAWGSSLGLVLIFLLIWVRGMPLWEAAVWGAGAILVLSVTISAALRPRADAEV